MDQISKKRLFDMMAESEREYREFLERQNYINPSPTPSLTFTPTMTPTSTLCPTPTPSLTPTATPTPTITQLPCPSSFNNFFRFISTMFRIFKKIFRNK